MSDDATLIATMRAALRPAGTAPVVRLDLNNKYFDEAFVQRCVDEVEKLVRMDGPMGLGGPSPLERLAIHLLMDSAGIEKKR